MGSRRLASSPEALLRAWAHSPSIFKSPSKRRWCQAHRTGGTEGQRGKPAPQGQKPESTAGQKGEYGREMIPSLALKNQT